VSESKQIPAQAGVSERKQTEISASWSKRAKQTKASASKPKGVSAKQSEQERTKTQVITDL